MYLTPKNSVPNILPRILPAVKKVLSLSYRNSLNNVLVTTCETSKTSNIEIAMSYQNIYGNSKTLIYHQLLSNVTKVLSKTIKFVYIMSL